MLFLDKQYNATDTKNTNVLGYAALNGKLQDSTGTLTLPADLSDQEYGKDYYAYLVAETDNGEKRTNSASTPTQITIPPKPWTDAGSITINGGSVTAAGETNEPESVVDIAVRLAQSPSTAAASPQPAEQMQPESAAAIKVRVAASPSAAAASPQPAEQVSSASAMERTGQAVPFQPERTVKP